MNAVHITFPGGDQGCWEQRLLDLVQPRVEDLSAEAITYSGSVVANQPAEMRESPLPPPPQWGNDEPSYAGLVEEGTEAMLDRRYADAHLAFERALVMNPSGAEAPMLQGNVNRLRELMKTR